MKKTALVVVLAAVLCAVVTLTAGLMNQKQSPSPSTVPTATTSIKTNTSDQALPLIAVQEFTSKLPVDDSTRLRIEEIAHEILGQAKPLYSHYSSIFYNVTVLSSNGTGTYVVEIKALSSIAGTQSAESYSITFNYSANDGKYLIQSRIHGKKYVPADVSEKCITVCENDQVVKEFKTKYQSYTVTVTYLDEVEVETFKRSWPDTYGFLPNRPVLLVLYETSSPGIEERPTTVVYMSEDYTILGVIKMWWQ
jgi:hypothetical protein